MAGRRRASAGQCDLDGARVILGGHLPVSKAIALKLPFSSGERLQRLPAIMLFERIFLDESVFGLPG